MATGKKRTTPRARGAVVKPNPGPETLPLPETGRATGERHYRSEGQRLLAGLDLSRADLAKALGASDSMVGFLKAGTKNPGPDIQRRAEKLGIPRATWGQAARTGDELEPAPMARSAAEVADPGTLGTSLAEVEAWLRGAAAIRDSYLDERHPERPTPGEYLKAADTATRLIAQRSKLLGDSRSDEEKLAASARWRAIKATLARVLLRHPQAARDVADALEAEGLA
jgi:hypothetical protein